MTEPVILERRDEHGVLTIVLNRPERRNAITAALAEAWADALRSAQADPGTRAIVVTGAGTAFCAGGDFEDFDADRGAVDQKAFLLEHVFRVARTLEDVDKPVIAMINGAAMGAGLDMALLCDLRFAAEDARLGEAYVDVGVTAGDGGAWLLPRLIGIPRALDLLWTGRRIDGREAARIGLVDHAVPADQLAAVTLDYARALARGPLEAIRITKRAVYQAAGMDLRTHVDMMSSHMAVLRQTPDYQEGLAALRAKRRPVFGAGADCSDGASPG
jgi:enoyl-CoA hydratase/carnithine racemase